MKYTYQDLNQHENGQLKQVILGEVKPTKRTIELLEYKIKYLKMIRRNKWPSKN